MATSSTIRMMISSRCNDAFPAPGGRTLSEIRRDLKTEIEKAKLFGKAIFEVWINEETPPQGGSWDSWEVCLKAVKEADILLVLANGNAGWGRESGDIGICHAELMTAMNRTPGKVWLISLGDVPVDDSSPQGARNGRFQRYVEEQSRFRGDSVTTEKALRQRVHEALRDAVVRLTQAGVRESGKGGYDTGDALDWSHRDFRSRRDEMRRVLRDVMLQRAGSREVATGEPADPLGPVVVTLDGKEVLVVPDAIPAALSVGPAKELVGQPFLEDYRRASLLGDGIGGPLHVIACHKGATETQATKLLGFPDATVVTAGFGVFVADNIQMVQFAFIIQCRDETTTRHGAQRFFEWLTQSGEGTLVAERASRRAKVVDAIAQAAMR